MEAEANKRDLENYLELIKAIYNETPEPPCTGCPFYKTCATKHVSCKDFFQYSKTGTLPRNSIPKFRNPNFHWFYLTFLNPRTQPEV